MSDGARQNRRHVTDANGNAVWNSNVPADEPERLLGYPVYVSADMAAPAASAKSVMFGNWSKAYLVRRVAGFAVDRLVELFSLSGQIGFKGYERVDGRVLIADAARALQHSAT